MSTIIRYLDLRDGSTWDRTLAPWEDLHTELVKLSNERRAHRERTGKYPPVIHAAVNPQ